MRLTREDLYGIVATVLFHLLLLLLLLFFFLQVQPPDPPLPPGMEIDFGISVDGSGTNNMAMPTAPVVSENPSKVTTQAVSAASEDVKTSDVGETMPVSQNKPKPNTEKPVENPKPVINQGALLPGKRNDGGQGSGSTPGNQGRLDGNPSGASGQGGTGNNPTTSGKGIKISLAGRSPLSIPSFTYNEQEDGIVVVKITVNRNGKVVNATTDGVLGSTTTNKVLHALAIENAKKTTFNLKGDAPPEQIGYMTFNFQRQ